jgi:midasin (ATPase involved in ribosome maturation)
MKSYITRAYIDMLQDSTKSTGVYYATPKVIVKGDKYRKALNPTEKLIYQELYDLSMKAAHSGQFDSRGIAYVKVSYSFIATAIGVDPSTVDRTLTKRKTLFRLGLLAYKKKGIKSEHEYYVMAPVYEGADEMYLTNDKASADMKMDAKNFSNRKNPNRTNEREVENEQLENERKSDRVIDKADQKVIAREYDEDPEQSEQTEPTQKHSPEYETLMKKIKSLGVKYHKVGREAELRSIVKYHFGSRKITQATESDLPKMKFAYEDLMRTALSQGII